MKTFTCLATPGEHGGWDVELLAEEPGYVTGLTKVGHTTTREDAVVLGQRAIREAKEKQAEQRHRFAQTFEITEDTL